MRHEDHDPSLICRPAFGNGLCSPLFVIVEEVNALQRRLAPAGQPRPGDGQREQGTAEQPAQHERGPSDKGR
jgi:hypothetical protein